MRSQWKESRFFYGKNRVMQLALGRSEAEEYKEGLHKVAQVSLAIIVRRTCKHVHCTCRYYITYETYTNVRCTHNFVHAQYGELGCLASWIL